MTPTTPPDPWLDIAPSESPGFDNVRRLDAAHPLDFKRGRDFQGKYLLILEGPKAPRLKPEIPSLDGISVSLHLSEPGFKLVLALTDQADLEIFRSLCQDLVGSTRNLGRDEYVRGLQLVLERVRRWQDLLRTTRQGLLETSEVIGLVGELLFLRDQILPRTTKAVGVAAWRGPYGDEQDYVLTGTILELKTQVASADARLQISSEHQLDTTSGPIVVVHQTISISADSEARGLNALVAELKTALADDPSALDLFCRGLIESRYIVRAEYDEPAWSPVTRRFYQVAEDFPRLTSSSMPQGVDRVRYSVGIAACAPFEIDGEVLMERLTRG